ncbi:hypothetical protein [Bradyrhizobium sp.]|uniref:hypothetical protein n=1 Tax=Bradyrhizobium sp. TaxID=376 RepID=UPI003C455642
MSVIDHDFGLQERQAARRFTKLLSLDALHEANVRANPVPYLERASERIFQLEKALVEAAQATAPPEGDPAPAETILVDKADYQRLLNCRAIIEKAVVELAPDAEATPVANNP